MKENGVAFNGMNSDYEKHRCGGQSDSGRGSTVYSSGKLQHTTDTSPDSSEPHRVAGNFTFMILYYELRFFFIFHSII